MISATEILQSLLNDRNRYSLQEFIHLTDRIANYPAVDLTVRDQNGHTLLDHLIFSNVNGANNQAIENLLQINKDLINLPDSTGCTPLHSLLLGSCNVSVEVIQQFIKWGSDIHHLDILFGESLLHACCYSGNLEAAIFLRNQGLDLMAKTKAGDTMLHCAVRSQNQALWSYLKISGIDVNAQNRDGETALHLAVRSNNPMMNWLFHNGANNKLLNNKGYPALYIPPNGKPSSDSCLSATSMQVLGGFIAVLGVAAVAVAFALLTATTLGVVAAIGAVAALAGLGLFAAATVNKCSPKQPDFQNMGSISDLINQSSPHV